jgi:hypothetical protein
MGAVLCPMGGSYWNPKPFWWVWNSWLSTGLYRVYDVVRVVLWVVGRLVDLVTTLFFAILMPIAGYIVTFLASFLAFMVGLLLGDINIEWSIMAPLLALLLSWSWWATYPAWGCWFQEHILPLYPMIGDITAKYVGLGAIIFNVLVRMWNACVPLIGAILAVCIEFFVLFFQLMVQLLGDGSFFKLFNLLTQIMVSLTEIFIAIVDAIVSISPSVIQALVGVVGFCLTIVMEAAPFLVPIFTWLFRVAWFVLEPIQDALIAIVHAFSGGNTVRTARNDEPPGSWPDAPPPQTPVPYYYNQKSEQIFLHISESASQYWTAGSASFAGGLLNDLNKWNALNPPGSQSYYHYMNGPELGEMPDIRAEYMSFEMLALHGHDPALADATSYDGSYDTVDDDYYDYSEEFDGDYEAASPTSLPERQARATRSYARRSADDIPNGGKERERKINNRTAHTHVPAHNKRLADHLTRNHLPPLHHDFHKRVQCKSALCGGHGKELPHPLLAIRRDQQYAGHVFGLGRETNEEHRSRYVRTMAVMHAARRAVHHVWHRHYHQSDGSFERHARSALKAVTGFDSASRLVEHMMSHHEHPAESIVSYVPVLSSHPVMRYLVSWDEPAHASRFYHNWVRTHDADAWGAVTGDDEDDEHHNMHARQYEPSPTGTFADAQPVSAAASAAQRASGKDKNTAPSLPVFKMLSKRTCVRRPGSHQPLNILCLPEIPAQLVCAVVEVVKKLFNGRLSKIQTCDYEPRCADIGFCMPERPNVEFSLFIVVDNLQFFISWCWLLNGIVWIAVAGGFVFPLAKTLLQTLGSQVLILKPITDWLYQLTPDVLVFNDLFCLFLYFYGLLLIIAIAIVVRLAIYPALLWFWRTVTSGEAVYSVIRSIEASRLARIEASEWFQLQERQFYVEPYLALRNDPWLVKPRRAAAVLDPGANMPSAGDLAASPLLRPASARIGVPIRVGADATPLISTAELAAAGAFDSSGEPSVGAGPGVDDGDVVTPELCQSMLLYTRSLQAARMQFGEPDPTVTLEQAHQFERRFAPLIQSLHFSHTWMRRFLGEQAHQRTADSDRRPVEVPHWSGSAAHAAPAPQSADMRPALVRPDMYDADL